MTETSVKVIKFSGKRQDWIAWHVKHLARATKKGHREVLLGNVVIPTKAEEEQLDPTVEADKLELKKVQLNIDAYSDLILSMEDGTPHGNIAFNIVRQAVMVDEYPNGNAAEAFARLKRKYNPETAPELARLHKLFHGTKQNKNQDPDLYISYLEDLRIRLAEMKSMMTDDQFIMHILNNLDREYEFQVNLMERRVGAATDPLTLEEVRDELCLRFERMSKQRPNGILGNDDEEEHALYAGAQFKGKCYVCGVIGHKGANCRERNQNRGGGRNGYGGRKFGGRFGGRGTGRGDGFKFKGNCHYCQKPGHKSSECRQRKADLNPRENADVVLMAEEGGLGRCIQCGGFGPLGNYCFSCEDSGFIYASISSDDEENDGHGNYWEENEDSDDSSSDLSVKDESGNIKILKKIKKKFYSFEPPTQEQIEKNEFVVLTNSDNSPEYAKRLRNHSTGNTDDGLFDLLIIIG